MAKVPNDWTKCEDYRGVTIAIKDGVYRGFDVAGASTRLFSSRAEVRRSIDNFELLTRDSGSGIH